MTISEKYAVPANDFTAKSSLRDFDLSQSQSIQTFELAARSIASRGVSHAPKPSTSSFLRTVLRTITSPAFSKVVVFYRYCDFGGLNFHWCNAQDIYRSMTPDERATDDLWHRRLFQVFRDMHTVRNFRLVLCADVWDRVGEYTVEVLKRAVATEEAAKRLDYLSSEPMVVCSPRGSIGR